MKLIYLFLVPLCFMLAAMLPVEKSSGHLDPIEAATGELRSPRWPKVRDEFLKTHPVCAVCGCKDDLQVHHIIPFHLDRKKELDPSNLITLCGAPHNHHLLFGHLNNFKSWNVNVVKDAAEWAKKIKERP